MMMTWERRIALYVVPGLLLSLFVVIAGIRHGKGIRFYQPKDAIDRALMAVWMATATYADGRPGSPAALEDILDLVVKDPGDDTAASVRQRLDAINGRVCEIVYAPEAMRNAPSGTTPVAYLNVNGAEYRVIDLRQRVTSVSERPDNRPGQRLPLRQTAQTLPAR